MPNIIFNIPLYFTVITTCIYTELAPKLITTASVIQGRGFNSQPGGLGVAFYATGPSWVLKCISFWHSNLPYFKRISSVDNEQCKGQILYLSVSYIGHYALIILMCYRWTLKKPSDSHGGPFQTSIFSCAEPNVNEQNLLFELICIRFGAWQERRLKRA